MIDNSMKLISNIHSKLDAFVNKRLNEEGLEGLSTSHGVIIVALIKNKTLTMSELSSITGKKPQTVTTLVTKLEKNKYLFIKNDNKDKRIRRVYPTNKLLELMPTFNKISEDINNFLYQGFNNQEYTNTYNTLKKLNDNLIK